MLRGRYPEGALLRNTRHAQDISTTDAAAKAETTEEQWAHVETGEGRRARADTIARMAHAVGIRSETLAPIRQDAADELEVIELQDHAGTPKFELRMRRLIDRMPESGDALVQELRTELDDTEATVQALRQRVADLDARTAERKDRMAELDARMAELQNRGSQRCREVRQRHHDHGARRRDCVREK